MATKSESSPMSQTKVPESLCLFGGWSRRKILKITDPVYEVIPHVPKEKEEAVAVS